MQRNLTLTEELEKLEQSITLTLQEIDSNFSKAHRIVTTSILPIVEQYGRHSNSVWEASKFWKQFFEASANVSLSGYEEPDEDEVTQDEASETVVTPTKEGDSTITDARAQDADEEEFSVDSPTQMTGLQATPKLPPSRGKRQDTTRGQTTRNAASLRSPSPRKYTGKNPAAIETSSDQPSTPQIRSHALDLGSSPFQPHSAFQPSAFRQQPLNDPLMHRVLDKNYRVQATPHTQRRTKPQPPSTSKKQPTVSSTTRALWEDSPQSSPAMAAPQLRSDLFSPARPAPSAAALSRQPRTPGVSVLTPNYRGKPSTTLPTTSTGRRLFSAQDKTYTAGTRSTRAFDHHNTPPANRTLNYQPSDAGDITADESLLFSEDEIDATRTSIHQQQQHTAANLDFHSDSDTDDFLHGMSPPKTLQFHVPQSRLLQTPAREASRRIVEDLLLTAGAEATDEIEVGDGIGYHRDDRYDGLDGESDVGDITDSPSVVRRMVTSDDTF